MTLINLYFLFNDINNFDLNLELQMIVFKIKIYSYANF